MVQSYENFVNESRRRQAIEWIKNYLKNKTMEFIETTSKGLITKDDIQLLVNIAKEDRVSQNEINDVLKQYGMDYAIKDFHKYYKQN